MSEAVVIGAGCIGRGFVAHLFSSAGWHVTFLDIDAPLVAALARDGSFVHVTVSTNESVRTVVGPVTGLDNGRDPDAAVAALVSADVAATAVGGSHLSEIAPLIAAAVAQRVALGRPPLNLLLCENLHGAATVMRGLLEPLLSPEGLAHVGILETSIDRTIRVVDPAIRASDPSIIYADPYRPLLYDVAAVRGPGFDVPGIVGDPSVPFAYFGERKLYVHNLGHTLTAYLGGRAGVDLVSDAIAIPEVGRLVRGAMVESATALASAYRQPITPLVDSSTTCLIASPIARCPTRSYGSAGSRSARRALATGCWARTCPPRARACPSPISPSPWRWVSTRWLGTTSGQPRRPTTTWTSTPWARTSAISSTRSSPSSRVRTSPPRSP